MYQNYMLYVITEAFGLGFELQLLTTRFLYSLSNIR